MHHVRGLQQLKLFLRPRTNKKDAPNGRMKTFVMRSKRMNKISIQTLSCNRKLKLARIKKRKSLKFIEKVGKKL